MRYRFTLEKYKGRRTRHNCPNCGKFEVFVRYVDTDTGRYLDDRVGRCNREVNCGYHYTPKQYFADNLTSPTSDFQRPAKPAKPPKNAPHKISTIPFEVFNMSLANS